MTAGSLAVRENWGKSGFSPAETGSSDRPTPDPEAAASTASSNRPLPLARRTIQTGIGSVDCAGRSESRVVIARTLFHMPGPACLRLIVAAAALIGPAVLGVMAEFGWSIGSRSPLLWGAVALAGMVELLLLRVAVWPRARFVDLQTRGQDWYALWTQPAEPAEPGPEARSTVVAGRWLCAIALAAFITNGALSLKTPDPPGDDDQGAYLQTAAEIQQSGGLGTLLRQLFAGEFGEANRHPLYLACLALDPTEATGRAISFAAALAAWLLAGWWVRRHSDSLTAGLALLMLATNRTFLFSASRVFCESLLMLTSLAAWMLLARVVRPAGHNGEIPNRLSPESSAAHLRSGRSSLAALLAGGALGLSWLTKATGLLLLVGALLHTAIAGWRNRSRTGGRTVALTLLWLAIGFVIVGSPLLARNVRRFGSPFYNVNSQLLFVDAYSDPGQLAEQHSTGEAAREYWRTHSLGQLARRAITGGVWEGYILLRSLGPAPLDDGRVLVGAPLALLGLMGALRGGAFPAALTAIWTVLLWACFAWYVPIAAGERFLVPLLIPWLIAAALGLTRLIPVCERASSTTAVSAISARAAWRLVLGGAIWAGVWTTAHCLWPLQ